MRASWMGVVLLGGLSVCGCDEDASGSDAGAAGDSSVGSDSGAVVDAGSLLDGGGGTDAGFPPDVDAGDPGTDMSFFVSSTALTSDGALGGLAAADAHCTALAAAVGAVRTSWVAYLSTEGLNGGTAVDAIDRIGTGPWFNANGDTLAADLAALHPTINPEIDRNGYIAVKPADALFMDESGAPIPERSHDIFTGSEPDGTVFVGRTCQDWTSNSRADIAQVGHTDTPANEDFSPSWNSAHDTRNCSEDGVRSRGGVGLIYCFASP